MKANTKRIFGSVLAVLVATIAHTCFAEQVTVVDEATARPIAGAQVLVYWSARRFKIVEGGDSLCWGLSATTSDANGQFDVPAFSWNINPFNYHRARNVALAARGYTYSTKSDSTNLKFVLRSLADPKLDPYEAKVDFNLIFRAHNVDSDCGDIKVALPFLKVSYQNLKLLTNSQDDEAKLFDRYYGMQTVEFGPEDARQNARRKWLEERSQKHLKESAK